MYRHFRSCRYQGWGCHLGVTMIRWYIHSSRIFLRTRLIKLNGRNAKPYYLSQGCRMHLLLYCTSLFSMQCMYWMKSHAFRVWMQTDPELFVPSVLLSLKKLKHLVSILNWPWGFVTPSVHVHSEHLEHTLKIMQFVCWEKNYIWFWWCARVFCFVYPQIPKDMNLPPYCLSTSELLYLIVLS